MDPTTVNSVTVQLATAANPEIPLPATVTYSITSRVATLTPASRLVTSTSYRVTVIGGASGVKDLAGNALATTFNSTLSTAAPSVTLSLSGSPMAEAGGVATVMATLSASSSQTVTVNLAFSGTATSGSDYTASASSITIPPGSLTGQITLTAIQDNLDETNETIIVDISSVTNGTESGTQRVTATITDDDPLPTVTLGLTGSPMAEAGGVATVTATLSAVSGRNVTVSLAFSGTATLTSDYTRSASSIVIPAGSLSGQITLTAVQDSIIESNETIIVNISSVTNGTEAGTQRVTATIIDDDSLPTVTLGLSGSPMAEAGGVATVTATVSAPTSQPVTVNLAFSGTAILNTDYTRSASSITIPAGSLTGSISLTAVQDTLVEGNETIVVDISSVTNATESGTQQVTATITDDETLPTVTLGLSGSPMAEAGGVATVTATLSAATNQLVTVNLAFSGTATLNTDYTRSASSITIPAGSLSGQITLTAVQDSLVEGNETIVVDISSVTNATESGTQQVTATITDSGGLGPCTPPITSIIACENTKPGNPASDWDISGAGSANIQGFATDISFNKGEVVDFKIDTDALAYHLDIYRMGYYGGLGARKIVTINPAVALPQIQPPCLNDTSTGLIDCGNWSVSAVWNIPTDAVSGIYFAKLVRDDGTGSSHIVFIVRDDSSTSQLLFQTSDTTWQAYNQYGGNSLYVGSPDGRAYKVSYNRPFNTRSVDDGQDWVFNAEYPMVRWLEANGYDVTYFTAVDTDRRGSLILNHRVFMSVGHDEYWSAGQRTNVEAARNAGVHLTFFSGNEIFWKTRWEPSVDGSNTPSRTLVSYKETHANATIDPLDPPIWTGTWRDPRFSPPADGGRPENALSGTIFTVNDSGVEYSITVPEPFGKFRLWRNTSIATLAPGQVATLPLGTLGYEWDEALDNGSRPAGLFTLSSTTLNVPSKLQDFGSTYGAGTATHALTLYRHSSGALVFGAGTIQWTWGLDSHHDRGSAAADIRMQQATVNLFADMGVQPATLQPGLIAATQSADTTAPVSTITAPTAGANITPGSTVNITGTASDSSGGLVAAVEVSVDGGLTWHAAVGRGSWSYSWIANASGSVTIKSRAVDDTGNIEAPGTGVTVTVGSGSGSCPCSLWSSTTTPAVLFDGDTSSVELGVKFRADVDGTITALRFYKSPNSTGAHAGNLWSSTGTLLATANFVNETASGWQQVSLPAPVNVTANTIYVASYHTSGYPADSGYFNTTGYDNTPLHAPSTGIAGGNGVYQYGATSAFPNQTFNGTNYWVDVVFNPSAADTTPPTVVSVTPANGATGVPTNTGVTITFSEDMTASTISTSTVELRDAANALMGSTVIYNAATRTATLTPNPALAPSSSFTVRVLGGAVDPRVKDLAGNALAATFTSSFATAATGGSCPCTIWSNAATPVLLSANDFSPVELGVKFSSQLSGFITGLRFYKSPNSSGTHVGNLWTSTGTNLASVTFTNETVSGWQQVNLPSPVSINANTTYVASYHTTDYAADGGYFAAGGVINSPLSALANGQDGPNGVYVYGSGGFPTQTFNSTNYWVDVVFSTSGPADTTPPTIISVSPSVSSVGVSTTANITARFSESMTSSTISTGTFELRDPSSVVVPATVTYDSVNQLATLKPSVSLATSTTYRATVKGGSSGVKDLAGNAMTGDVTWTFSTAAPPPPPMNQGSGGPILVVTSQSNPFGNYYAEILRAEGLNAFDVADIGSVTSTTLASHDVVILGEMLLSGGQATLITNWVNAGGKLIAMRPDKQLAGFLGLIDAGTTLSDAYLLVNTTVAPGTGIVGQTIQFHGMADRYSVSGATLVATLYSNATTPTANPAVTMRGVGSAGGQAAAFTYDLARSIVYTRQGNPSWAGQERDGISPIRSDDLFFGGVEIDWIDLNKVAIPQADEQQRLLANLIIQMTRDRKPLPRFWYLPDGLTAAVLMTGDDHGNGGTSGRWNSYISKSPAGCSVEDWECIRGTSYIYPSTPISDAQAAFYQSNGFELGLHVLTNCADWTPSTLASFYSDQLGQFAANFPSVAAPATNRTHCIVWSDWASQPKVERSDSIRLDANYYYWPGSWITDRPGFMTGSGMPMRFADLDGTMIDVYQAATQMTDESDQTYPFTIDTLLDRALGPEGYYGVFTANMHTDNAETAQDDAIIASALARHVPVITARQVLKWVDGRNGSSIPSLSWNGSTLSFTLNIGEGANGLFVMLPTNMAAGSLSNITLNGVTVPFATGVIKGVSYAMFPAAVGNYQVAYTGP